MKKSTYLLKNLSINRMPGFRKGLKPLHLAKNINLITGPNASGKSSTARVIQQVIWPTATKGLEVQAGVEIESDSWQIVIESEGFRIQHNGIEEKMIGLPAAEGRHRYHLPLHDLIKEEEQDLAMEIMKESNGGYDLDAAKNVLEYSNTVTTVRASQVKEHREKEERYKKVLEAHQKLKNDEDLLGELLQKKEKATKAVGLQRFFELTGEYLQERQQHENLKLQKNNYPASMERVKGDELETINDLEQKLSDSQNAIERATEQIRVEQLKLDRLQISNTDISPVSVTSLRSRLANFKEHNREIIDLERQLLALQEEQTAAVKAIDSSMDPSGWAGLDLQHTDDLDKLLKEGHEVLGKKEFLEAEINRFEAELCKLGESPNSTEDLLQGITCLALWLKEQKAEGGVSPKAIIISGILGALTAIACVFFGQLGLVGLFALVAFCMYSLKAGGPIGSSSVRKEDFEKLKLPFPEKWEAEKVTIHLDSLVTLLRDKKKREHLQLGMENALKQLKALRPEIDGLHDKQRGWKEKLGGAPEMAANNFSSLYWFLIHARNWQKAHSSYKALEGKKTAEHHLMAEELAQMNKLYGECNLGPVKDWPAAEGLLQDLESQLIKKSEALGQISLQQSQLNQARRNKKEAAERLESIYMRLILPQGDKAGMQKLIEDLEAFKSLSQRLFASGQNLLEKEARLKAHSGFGEYQVLLKDWTLDQAEAETRRFTMEANTLEALSQEVTTIETLIHSKKNGHELEDLISEKQKNLEALQDLFQHNLQSLTGDLLVEQLKQETRDQNRPAVFRRANELLGRITNHRYKLLLDERDVPGFKAFDTVLQQGLDLSEISTGTRVQLLLAVRLAFVETQEAALKLPILADELLANSDDERATAIIKALIEISKEGRQVFYFTAQVDEIHKWQSLLEKEPEVDYKVISLRDGAKLPEIGYRSAEEFRWIREVQDLTNYTHEESGRLLEIAPFNLLEQDAAELPLWYLIEDVQLLHQCLRNHLTTWGQLESFMSWKGTLEGLEPDLKEDFKKKVKVLERLIYLSRKGREISITREVLENSGAVSTTFIEPVSEKLKEVNGNASQLLHALENKVVSRFSASNIKKLRQYLLDQQYLKEEESLGKEEISAQLAAYISRMDLSVEEAERFCNRILRGAGSSAAADSETFED